MRQRVKASPHSYYRVGGAGCRGPHQMRIGVPKGSPHPGRRPWPGRPREGRGLAILQRRAVSTRDSRCGAAALSPSPSSTSAPAALELVRARARRPAALMERPRDSPPSSAPPVARPPLAGARQSPPRRDRRHCARARPPRRPRPQPLLRMGLHLRRRVGCRRQHRPAPHPRLALPRPRQQHRRRPPPQRRRPLARHHLARLRRRLHRPGARPLRRRHQPGPAPPPHWPDAGRLADRLRQVGCSIDCRPATSCAGV